MLEHALICPVCNERLSIDITSAAKYKSVSCSNKHLFDFAKQGYLNLLLSQHKKSKHPGDTQEMVQARSHFLNSGFYQSISDYLINTCISLPTESTNNDTFHYCDLACGEGYYTQNVHRYLKGGSSLSSSTSVSNIISTGLDISMPAIKAACQRTKDIQWLIASLSRSPLASNSQDLITGLFFHFDLIEIERILKPNGQFIMVTTGPKHLIELRKAIYDVVKDETIKDFNVQDSGLEHINTLNMQDKKTLNSSADILALLTMTPHYWRCTQEKKQQLELLSSLELTLDIQFDIFIKSARP